MAIPLLREFVLSVPTCVETDTLLKAWQLFNQTGSDRILVLDKQQKPVGMLTLNRIMPYCLKECTSLSEAAPILSIAWSSEQAHLHQTLQSFQQASLATHQPLLEPLVCLPHHWNLEQFQPHLSETSQRQWVLVNPLGQAVGLLDSFKLLQFWVMNPPSASSQYSPKVEPPLHQLSTASYLRHQCASELIAPSRVVLDPLIDVLERLPIPLMVQTTTGRVVTQNLAWRQQVGELQDPTQVQREAALILESAAALAAHQSASGSYLVAEAGSLLGQPQKVTLSDHYSDPEHPENLESSTICPTGSCQVGVEPNTCVCVCPMKSGSDRIWKFIKIALGAASLQSTVDPSALMASLSESSSHLSRFKLANLRFSPDPAWRALVQTESLWLVMAQDLTEQQQVAKELAAKNADLVQLNRFKDEFLACISHELKTPLTAVLGLSSLLKDQSLGTLNERQARYAQLIHESGRHLISIVNDILDLTRIETGQLELMPEPVNIETVCTRAYTQAHRLLQTPEFSSDTLASKPEEEVAFSLNIYPGLESIVADEPRLRQMLANLLSNALKFTEVEGRIGLTVENWEGWIAFTVWDTGIGIPANKQHLIFQKFQQLENPLTRRFEGTGLGLVLTQRLARMHGGDVSFISTEGKGSQFTLLLPPNPPQTSPDLETGASRAAKPGITARNRLVLIVEAAPQLLGDLTSSLSELGYRVAIARSGTEALEKIRRLQPGVVFLNPLLPVLSGWDVLTLLKADEVTNHVPVVVTATRVEKDQAYQNGADAFLSLPIQLPALQHCLDRLLQTLGEPIISASELTIMHLYEPLEPERHLSTAPSSSPVHGLSNLLHAHNHRVLEVDDLEQAELLARVWKPNVVLLNGKLSTPHTYLEQLSQFSYLATLPIVTLTAEVTQAANQIPGLSIFPCLAVPTLTEVDAQTGDISALLQVIQLAAGVSWLPHILIVDFNSLIDGGDQAPSEDSIEQTRSQLQALVQYIRAAGFRSSISYSWGRILQKLQHQSVDLLLLCVAPSVSYSLLLEKTQSLKQFRTKPPIVVWNYKRSACTQTQDMQDELQGLWRRVATKVLHSSLPMRDLLVEIRQLLSEQQHR